MNKVKKYIPEFLAVISFFLLWWHLQASQEFMFFYREQQQLFLFSLPEFADRYFTVGGLSLFLSQFLCQFFSLPLLGSAVTAAFGAFSAYLLWRIASRWGTPFWTYPLFILPVFVQTHALYDNFYAYDGYCAFFIAILMLWIWQICFSKGKPIARLIAGMLMSSAGYLLIGPASMIFVIGIVVLDFLNHASMPYIQLLSIAAFFLTYFIALKAGAVEDFQKGVLSSFYYDQALIPPLVYDADVIVVPLLLIIAFLLRKAVFNSWLLDLSFLCLAALLDVGAVALLSRRDVRENYVLVRLQQDMISEDWDDILNCREAISENNHFNMNFVNLALQHKGLLLERLFTYRQGNAMSLLYESTNTEYNPRVTFLYAHVLYYLGDIGGAQNKAFDTFVSYEYGNPSMLQLLVKTNIIYRNYKVAEKYISILEKTWGYRKWAGEQRSLLSDEASDMDPEISGKRKGLPDSDIFSLHGDFYKYLETILENNGGNEAARDYAMAYLLFFRDKGLIDDFFQRFPPKSTFGTLPSLVQQAIVVINEHDLDLCREMGVGDEVIDQYNLFKETGRNASLSGRNPRNDLKAKFGNSFWYYFLYGES